MGLVDRLRAIFRRSPPAAPALPPGEPTLADVAAAVQQMATATSRADYEAGFATVVLRDYDNNDLTAGSFEAVAQLQRKKELHMFHAEYSCEGGDPCGVCIEDRVDATNGVGIALCLTELIQPEVLSDFALGALDVRLKSATNFVSEVDPNDATLRVVGANIEVTVK